MTDNNDFRTRAKKAALAVIITLAVVGIYIVFYELLVYLFPDHIDKEMSPTLLTIVTVGAMTIVCKRLGLYERFKK